MIPLLPDLSRRSMELEDMDRPDCALSQLRRTVAQYFWINFLFSASRRLIEQHLFPAIAARPALEYTWLDIGAGGCDLPVWVARTARQRGWKLRITALDNDPRILAWAREAVRSEPGITLVQGSADELAALGEFDFIFSNHVLHHLADDQLRPLIASVNRQARLGFVLNDLQRARSSYVAYFLFASIFLHRSLALRDGLLSIRRGFLESELRALAGESLLAAGAFVFTTPPGRIGLARPAISRHQTEAKSDGAAGTLNIAEHPVHSYGGLHS